MNQAVTRNSDRFPPGFMFQLSGAELEILRSQNVASRWGSLRYLSYASTKQRTPMLSGVLRIETAVAVIIGFCVLPDQLRFFPGHLSRYPRHFQHFRKVCMEKKGGELQENNEKIQAGKPADIPVKPVAIAGRRV